MTPDRIQDTIHEFQRTALGYLEEHARWIHAAVYVGDYNICEATRYGVRIADMFGYLGGYLIRVRRDPKLSSDESWTIAMRAVFRLKEPYAFRIAVRLWWDSKRGHLLIRRFPRNVPPYAGVICSQLYADAYGEVTWQALDNTVDHPVVPASLSCTKQMQDVESRWLEIR